MSRDELLTTIGPGLGAFLACFFIAICLWFLMKSMTGHLRRISYAERDDQGKSTSDAGPNDAGRCATCSTRAAAYRLDGRLPVGRHGCRAVATSLLRPERFDQVAQATGAAARTTSTTAVKCAAKAANVSAWKISWNPNHLGDGFGRLIP